MMTCELDGVMKRHIGYIGAAGAHRASRHSQRPQRGRSVSISFRLFETVVRKRTTTWWETEKVKSFLLLARALRLADITKVILVLPHRAVCTLIRYFDFSTALGWYVIVWGIILDEICRVKERIMCKRMCGRIRGIGYLLHVAGPAWWVALRAAACTHRRCPGARTAWRARWAAAC